jgi:hypothetical protein
VPDEESEAPDPARETPRTNPAVEGGELISDPDVELTESADRCECPAAWTGVRVTLEAVSTSATDTDAGPADIAAADTGLADAGALDGGTPGTQSWTLEVPFDEGTCGQERVYGRLTYGCGSADLRFDVCSGPDGQRPCLHAELGAVQFVAAAGRIFQGRGAVSWADDEVDGVVSGELNVIVYEGETGFRLFAAFAFCGDAVTGRIVC